MKRFKLIAYIIYSVVISILDTYTIPKKTSKSDRTIIVRVDNIGDFVLWLRCASELSEQYNKGTLPVLICNESCVDLASAIGFFSEVIGVSISRFTRDMRYRWEVLRCVALIDAGVAIQPTYSRSFLTGDSIIRACSASTKIGIAGDLVNSFKYIHSIANRWYTRLTLVDKVYTSEIDRNVQFMHAIGFKNIKQEILQLPKLLELESRKKIVEKYFILFPGSSAVARQWPVEYFSKVGEEIIKLYGWKPVICGAHGDIDICKDLHDKLKNHDCINYAGQTSLCEFIEIVRNAAIVISNETSAVHISAAVNTPCVCILGGGHFGRFLPYPEIHGCKKSFPVINKMECFNCNWDCKHPLKTNNSVPCITSITPEMVTIKIEDVLSNEKYK